MARIIGTCSVCGGDVVQEVSFMSVVMPKPTCLQCGATKKNDLPVIEMEKNKSENLLLS